ncbi:hypothetical protein [Colwellia psychrerythraea]|uniref:Uncharacterized protein n=1 Tax=Colwellia psychrerythraea TaxID=28229 RepID=A0A099KJS5_COLPS|nr:hypothetical protein [Colwellia psychrerythraea]KGJ90217.1 hypothetical protein GAB14E_3702 [Colwellia psychrerythraea]
MSSVKKYSLFIRVICGVLGVSTIGVMIFNALNSEQFVFEFKVVAIAFAVCIFIFTAITGTNPLASINGDKQA